MYTSDLNSLFIIINHLTLLELVTNCRYFASGMVTVGGALGTFIFPPLFLLLIETYTWRGSLLINAGIAAQLYVCAVVMRPTPQQHTSLNATKPSKLSRFIVVKSTVPQRVPIEYQQFSSDKTTALKVFTQEN